jgi:hypothetical protein
MVLSIPLGAPGVSFRSPEPLRALTDVRLDICGFVGVAPRGPARLPQPPLPWEPRRAPDDQRPPVRHAVPVAVDSWEEYRRRFGSFEGPGLLPYAVASFFENGGRRAWVVRIVHDYTRDPLVKDVVHADENERGRAGAPLGTLRTRAGAPVRLLANNEGAWGNRLYARLSFTTRPLPTDQPSLQSDRILIAPGTELPAGTLLRLRLGGGTPVLRRLASVEERWNENLTRRERWGLFEATTHGTPRSAEVVEGRLEIEDHDPRFAGRIDRHERYEGLGLSTAHPRWLARELWDKSELLLPDLAWLDEELDIDAALAGHTTSPFEGGLDRYRHIVEQDFFDLLWTPAEEYSWRGIHSLADVSELGLLVVADLYAPRPLGEQAAVDDPGPLGGPSFAPCVTPATPREAPPAPDDLDGLRLDPRADLEQVVSRQLRVVEMADQLRTLSVLLDVPPTLDQGRILKWRAAFDSAYAAAYHPWLRVARSDDAFDGTVLVPPSGVAAGIVARQELAFGLHHGPANVIAEGVVGVEERVPPLRHDQLHPAGVNVYLVERDGVRLTAARTLARDARWRQLSVRRLVTMVKLVLDREMQWAVFEPNGAPLRSKVVQLVEAFLRRLFRLGALAGAKEDEAFFVRCNEGLNPISVVDEGRLVCEVGLAPAEPLEFIVVDVVREGDGTLRVEA